MSTALRQAQFAVEISRGVHMKGMRLLIAACIAGMVAQSAYLSVYAAPSGQTELPKEGVASSYSKENTYHTYLEKLGGLKPLAEQKQILIAASSYSKSGSSNIDEYPGKPGSIVINDLPGRVTWSFHVPAAGWYQIAFDYKAIKSSKNDIEFSLSIDGKKPFYEVESLILTRLWQDKTGAQKKQDEKGNDIRPQTEEVLDWQSYEVKDKEGKYSEPFAFYLTEGEHTLTLENISQEVALSQIRLNDKKKEPAYADYLKENSSIKKYQGKKIRIEAENVYLKSKPSLIAINDMTSPLTTPYDAFKIRLNSFGGNNWKYIGDRVYWKVTVPETALYRVSVRYRQNFYNGMQTHRRLFVNGEVPFSEANDMKFGYAASWQSDVMGDYYIRLHEGENILGMEAVLGEYADILRVLEETIFNLNHVYRKIIMVTGTVPDIYRDYNLEKEIPGLLDSLQENHRVIQGLVQSIISTTGKRGSEVSQLEELSRQIQDMIDKPYTITKNQRLDRFKSNISALGAWQMRLREQPLEIDSITLLPESGAPPKGDANFFEEIIHRIKRFAASFVEDYSVLGSSRGEKNVRVWIQTGRDQAQILKNMIDDTFTPQTGISVQLELVQGGMIEALLAGKGPDVALGRGDNEPVNFAMRGALYDFSRFKDFPEVKSWFIAGACTPYEYRGGCYGLPERQTFDMMFYRKDVFDELKLNPPKTWDELLMDVLPVMQRNNMEAGVGNINKMADAGASNIFTTLLYQKGGSLYSKDLTKAVLNEQVSYEAFKMAVELYRDYKLPREYDFMNRFRTGEMPLALAPYTMYNNLSIGAPELNGLWEMVPIPGILKEDGSINNTQVVNATSVVMYQGAKDPESAWSFIKWWVGQEAQSRFGNDQEAVLGPSGRYDTANVKALKELPWNAKQLALLEAQRDRSTMVAQLPGSYFTSRAINNAFVSSVVEYKIPREELLYWNDQMNIELQRKRLEFGFQPTGGNNE